MKNNYKNIFRSAILACLLPLALSAQKPDIRFEQLPRLERFSQSNFYCLYQDHKGFIWIGTQDGLNRYDGYEIKIYRHDPKDPGSLGVSGVSNIYEDRSGNFWVGGRGGINILDRETERFIRLQPDSTNPGSISHNSLSAIYEDRRLRLWIGTRDGLNLYDPQNGTFTVFKHDPGDSYSRGGNRITAIAEDPSGKLWIGTARAGLTTFDTDGHIFTQFHYNPEYPHSLTRGWINDIFQDKNGAMWLSTSRGLYQYDPLNDRFKTFKAVPDTAWHLRNHFNKIYEDSEGLFWVGNAMEGVTVFDRESESFHYYESDPGSPGSFWGRANTMFEDRSGILWMGGIGINFIDRRKQKFNFYDNFRLSGSKGRDLDVRAICEDAAGDIWVSIGNGTLSRLDSDGRNRTLYTHNSQNPESIRPHGSVRSMWEDGSGILWIGTMGGGLNRFDRETESFTAFQHDPNNPHSISHNEILFIFIDSQDEFWAGTFGGGLNKFDRNTGQFQHFRHDPDNPASISSDLMRAMAEDSLGNLWVGTYNGGLNWFDRDNGRFIRFQHDPDDPESLSRDHVMAITVAKNGTIWLGTGAGLNKLVFETDSAGQLPVNKTVKFIHYTTSDGLPNNFVYGILEDGSGNLWLSTNHGITKFDPRAETFRNYDIQDGLQSLEFNGQSSFKSPHTGNMYFGGILGVNAFHPDSVKDNPIPPQMVFTDFKVFNHSARIAGKDPFPEIKSARVQDTDRNPFYLKQSITETKEILLSYRESVISFEFAALHYSLSEENQYAYKMEGFDENWIYSGTRRFATYTNLSPGDYIFRVKGANYDGVWNEEGAAIKLTITPPWWKTNWAYGLYLLTAIGMLYGVRKFELNRQRKNILLQETKKRVKLAEERARERAEMLEIVEKKNVELDDKNRKIIETQEQLIVQEKLASLGQLTAGIAHEIKNPLNFVNNFAELSEDLVKELKEELDDHAEKLGKDSVEYIEEIMTDLANNAAKIHEHGTRADGIVKGMLEHSRGKSGEFQTVDLHDLLEEYINIAYHGMRARQADFNVTIEKEYDESVGKIPLVPQDISRVFLNILNNAFEAVHESGGNQPPTVWITSANRGETVEIRIRDNGPGIPEKIRKEIFNPFFTTKPTGRGNTGLGLSISHDIVVKVHRGEIRIESKEGEFTEFLILLPKG